MQQLRDNTFLTADQRWEALINRDPRAENAFFYGVKTTRIYCRPTCASRLPRRENVCFLDTCTAAETAGFRACKRCQPRTTSPQQQQAAMIAQICQQIQSSETTLSLQELATIAGFSPFHFQRVFKAIVGITPKQYEMAQRTNKLQQKLGATDSVTEAIYNAQFETSSNFYTGAMEMLGMQPTTYRKGGAGVTIRYGVHLCDLGWLLVAATDRGICAIQFSDDPETAIAQLKARFPRATFHTDDPDFDRWVEAAIALVTTPEKGLSLPLDIQGTAFQRQVWQVLQAIPPGQTVSYTDLAQRLGNPKAVRAVARACASNDIAVAIPCHRVVGKDGSLTGYRWGIDRKQALLEREAAQSSNPGTLKNYTVPVQKLEG